MANGYMTPERTETGTVSAFTFISMPTLGGRERVRKISMGTQHCVSMEIAKDMVRELRDGSHGFQVHAEVKFML